MRRYGEDRTRPAPRRRWAAVVVSLGTAVAIAGGSCTGGNGPGASSAGRRSGTIPQPGVPGLAIAPDSQRVDLAVPTFSHSTRVTNPLFPVSKQASVLLLGHVEGKPFRTEVTLLPYTRVIEWEGQRIETLVSQYLAYLDGRIQEIAYDLYAQADDGSVWYFGEDVSDFDNGAIITKEGTWLAGKDAPGAMIMPGHPKVGDVFRTENSPGFAFEQVTVKSVGQRFDGPLGPVDGGLVGEELHQDGKTEGKQFAPGYGEFYTADGPDVEALALAVPTDALSGPLPAELVTLKSNALTVFEAAGSGDWNAASASVGPMTTAWDAYRAAGVPKSILPRMTGALDALAAAVGSRDARASRQAAIDTAQWSLDLQLRYRPPVEVNLGRFDLWAAQVLVDAAARDVGAVRGDAFTLTYIRDRILRSVGAADLGRINTTLQALQVAATDKDFGAASDAATQLRSTLAGLLPTT